MKNHKKFLATALLMGALAVVAAFTSFAKVRLSEPDDTFWEGTKANWSEVEEANKYAVRLYREGSYVSGSEVQTKKTSYSFKSKMTKEGYYSYRVRALAKGKDFSDSNWSEYSDEYLITADEAKRIETANEAAKQQRLQNINTGGSGPGDDSKNPQNNQETSASGWKQDNTGWWYVNADSTSPKNQWQEINSAWYYFSDDNYMASGWLTIGEQTYYCEPATGAMLTGAQTIEGQPYTFDATGALVK